MIEIKITLNEGKSKNFTDIRSTEVICDIEETKMNSSKCEMQACKVLKERLGYDKKCEIIDFTKEQKYKNLQDEVDKFLEFIEKHKDISLD